MSALTAEISAAIEDYHRVWPIPHDLSPNLKLASRALAELEQHRALVTALRSRFDSAAMDLILRDFAPACVIGETMAG